jgi:hypothetical protein
MQGGAPEQGPQPRPEKDIERGEASMDPVQAPTEQRGMNADSTLYHEHEERYSTKIVHPRRELENAVAVGPQLWICPRHPEIRVDTPGGRCPECSTVLVPVKVQSDE